MLFYYTILCTTSVTQLKVFKLKLSEALGFHRLTAKLVEEQMNDKEHNRASEEKLVKVRETETERETETGREKDTDKDREREGGRVQRSCRKGVVQGNEEGEREVVED